MANTFFKSLTEADRTSSRTLLHEAIPITGALVSGTYATRTDSDAIVRENNIKTFSHGIFQTIYDYPYASSSANHIFDISRGVAPFVPKDSSNDFQGDYTSALHLYNKVVQGSGEDVAKKKRNIYNQMSQVLVGYDSSGSVRLFDRDGNFSTPVDKILDPTFINFSRLLVKDEIKKGSFSMDLGVNGTYTTPFLKQLTVADTGADTNYKVNSPAGEYGILVATNKVGTPIASAVGSNPAIGLIYYQAGIVVLDTSRIFHTHGHPDAGTSGSAGLEDKDGILDYNQVGTPAKRGAPWNSSNQTVSDILVSSSMDKFADGLRRRIRNISFNNTTELNSTIYFCRANHNEFNYSSNVTYLTGSQIRVKGGEVLSPPRSYVTTVGLYSADNELLAVAKLSEPLRKDPTNELTLRVRLDY